MSKMIFTIFAIASILLLLSTVICGLWLRYSGQEVTASSVNFHVMIGIATVIVSSVTVVMAMVRG